MTTTTTVKAQHQYLNAEGKLVDIPASDLQEFEGQGVRLAYPIRPEMPGPKCAYADHSYPAYTRAQMIEYSNDTAVLVVAEILELPDNMEIQKLKAEVADLKIQLAMMGGVQPLSDDDKQDGECLITLDAASGYKGRLSGRISAVQWGALSRIMASAALSSKFTP